jgi:hypothetical protein
LERRNINLGRSIIMATTKVIPGVLDLNQASSSTGLKMPSSNAAYSGPTVGEGMMRNEVGQTSNGSASCMQHFNGTDWKNFVNVINCTTATCGYPPTASVNALALYQMESDGGVSNSVPDTCGTYDGTAVSITYSAGKFGNAAVFNGLQSSSASYINISSSTTSTTSSISLWINTTVKDSNQGTILDGGGGSSANTGFSIIREATTGYLGVNFTNGTVGQIQSFTGATDITDGAWHNVVLSMAADNTFVFYLDGSSHLSGTRTRFTSGDTQNLSINRFGTNAASVGASSYGGQIDQVRIYDSALDLTQVGLLNTEIAC